MYADLSDIRLFSVYYTVAAEPCPDYRAPTE